MQVEEAPKKQAAGDAAKTKQEQEVARHWAGRIRIKSSRTLDALRIRRARNVR